MFRLQNQTEFLSTNTATATQNLHQVSITIKMLLICTIRAKKLPIQSLGLSKIFMLLSNPQILSQAVQ